MSCSNLIIMGCPGAGKSTVGVIVSELLGMKFVDFDRDVLECAWGMKVADKLIALGSDQFIDAEGEQFLKFTANNTVLSLSGSNPMHPKFKNHAQSLGKVFFLDISTEDNLKYINKKSDDAANGIVGKHDGMSWSEIIEYRQQFYVQNYDFRILCEKGESPKSIAQKIVKSWETLENDQYYISTRSLTSSSEAKSFLDVVIQGLASDGGLYVPKEAVPFFTLGQWQRLIPLSYQDRASRILEAWIKPSELHPSLLQGMIKKAYSNFQHNLIAPVKKINSRTYIQELFHGPTAAFKDLALQLMPQIFDEALRRQQGLLKDAKEIKYLILVATSGDTGSAVIQGFQSCKNVAVMVLYPEQGISPIQRQQMRSMSSKNIKVLGVQSDFDFCQTVMKQIFIDKDFGLRMWEKYNYKFSAANSINWGRLVPQVVYHASGYLELVKKGEITLGEPIDLCVPTGNCGNILAAYYAKKMGIPFQSLICASNTNNVLADFFSSGKYDLRYRHLERSISPSIDILKSSNLERFLHHVTQDGALVAKLFEQLTTERYFEISEELRQDIATFMDCGWASEDECKITIKTCFEKHNYLLDPHTAVGLSVAEKRRTQRACKLLLSATAHYSKFAQDVLLALEINPKSCTPRELFKQLEELHVEPEMNESLKNAIQKPEIHNEVCRKDINAVKEKIEYFLMELTAN